MCVLIFSDLDYSLHFSLFSESLPDATSYDDIAEVDMPFLIAHVSIFCSANHLHTQPFHVLLRFICSGSCTKSFGSWSSLSHFAISTSIQSLLPCWFCCSRTNSLHPKVCFGSCRASIAYKSLCQQLHYRIQVALSFTVTWF